MDQKEFSKKGGKATSPAKTTAARKNAKKPRGKWMTALAYVYISAKDGSERFGCMLLDGKPPYSQDKYFPWAEKIVQGDIGNNDHPVSTFMELSNRSRMV